MKASKKKEKIPQKKVSFGVYMKRRVLSLLLACCMTVSLAACGGNAKDVSNNNASSQQSSDSSETVEDAGASSEVADNSEIVDGKFVETRKITVEVYDRGNDGSSSLNRS